jgi:hypothetical protein
MTLKDGKKYTLDVHEQYKSRSGMPDDISDTFPCHSGVTVYLRVRSDFDNIDVEQCLTFDDQLQLLSTCNGWQRRLSNGFVAPAFIEAVEAVVELMYFDITGYKLVLSFGDCMKFGCIKYVLRIRSVVQLSVLTACDVTSIFQVLKGIVRDELVKIPDPNERSGKGIPLHKAIPERWIKNFPKVYQIPSTALDKDVIFAGIGVARNTVITNVLSNMRGRKRQRTDGPLDASVVQSCDDEDTV